MTFFEVSFKILRTLLVPTPKHLRELCDMVIEHLAWRSTPRRFSQTQWDEIRRLSAKQRQALFPADAKHPFPQRGPDP